MTSLRDCPTEPGPRSGTPGSMAVGWTFRYFGTKYHVRGVVDDRLVVCSWRAAKQRWEYQVFDHAWYSAAKESVEVLKPERIKPPGTSKMLTAGYLNSLVEDGASRPHGTWAEGHHEPREFAALASKEYGRVIHAWQVRRGYVRKAFGQVVMTEVPGRGAWAATWAEW